jgi:hypothetical protein
MRVELEAKGQPTGNMDLLIAARARRSRAVLVTNVAILDETLPPRCSAWRSIRRPCGRSSGAELTSITN